MMRVKLIISTVFWAILALNSFAQQEVLDRIVVVVGKDVILASEIAEQLQMVVFQSGNQPKSQEELLAIRNRVLEDMISNQLFLQEAKKDTSISIRSEEIDQALEEQISRMVERFGSEDAFQKALEEQNLTLRDLKKRYRSSIENELLKQKLIQKKLQGVTISRHEVEDFFLKFKDSIPNQPEAVKLAHLQLAIQPSQKVEDSVKQLATEIRKRILNGEDFGKLSEQYSSLGAGANGGDLGYIGQGDVVPEFARAAFNLSVGEISGLVRTQFGYHIIKCEGKKNERLWLRHVLLAVQPSVSDTVATIKLADSLLGLARSGSDFSELVKTFSSDNNTRAIGGDLGWFAMDKIIPEFADSTRDWKTPGEYRGPVKTSVGFHILKLIDYQPEKAYTLEQDFDKIKELARQDKTGKLVDKWLEQIKARTYIEYKLDDKAIG
jgi:peptidyl-prolyl cis-trans isomerase SurA